MKTNTLHKERSARSASAAWHGFFAQIRSKRYAFYILVFLFSTGFMLLATWKSLGSLYVSSPDGDLYLSIADNMIENGHFIQTARPYEVNMVVPPGLPIILTVLKLICNRNSFIVAVQYALFGMTNVLLADALFKFFDKLLPGILASVLYTHTMCGKCIAMTPSYILTETWMLFILCSLIWIAAKEYQTNHRSFKKTFTAAFLLIFVGFLIRPVLLMLYIVLFFFAVWGLKHKHLSWGYLAKLLLIPIIVLSMNTLINYRETRYFVVMDDYSGVPLYLANNPNTKTTSYSSTHAKEFFEDDMWELYTSKDYDTYQKNQVLHARTKSYILHNVALTIRRTLEKFWILFEWNKDFELMLLSALLVVLCNTNKKGKMIWPIAGVFSMLVVALPTACGLNIFRYSIIALPFYSAYKAIIFFYIVFALFSLIKAIVLFDRKSTTAPDPSSLNGDKMREYKDAMRILVIIPAYNEAENIERALKDLWCFCPDIDYVVINDCSTDDTQKVLKRLKANFLDLPVNLGIGGCMQTGFRYALEHDYDIAVQYDGDGQHMAKYIEDLVSPIINNNANIVIGSRFIEKQGYRSSKMRRAGIRWLSGLICMLSGVRVMDVTSGFRAVDRKLIRFFSQNYAQDYPEPEAVLILGCCDDVIIEEIPVQMREREGGTSSITLLKSIYYMIKVTLALFLARITYRKA